MRIVKRDENKTFYYLNPNRKIDSISHFFFKPTEIQFEDGSRTFSKCVNCQNPPCIYFDSNEIDNIEHFDKLSEFPYDNNRNVCVIDAIRINNETQFPKINDELCFGCGLCVRRCPVGAIFINQKISKAVIQTNFDDFYLIANNHEDIHYKKNVESFSVMQNKFNFLTIGSDYIINLISSIESINRDIQNFENILVRNLLLQLGVICKIRRIGDVNLRFDIFIESNKKIGVGEIDFKQLSFVESPRSLLDDIAVLHSRYNVNIDTIIPIIFCNKLINKRSDFYEIIYDINKVTQIQIHTIPFLALLAFYWFDKKIIIDDIESKFVLDKNKQEIFSDLIFFLDGNIPKKEILTLLQAEK